MFFLTIIKTFQDNIWGMLLVASFYILAVLSALILHEIAHGWVALKCGDPTAKFAGRLSLNPKKHLDPLGVLLFLIIGIGWAKPVPVQPANFRHQKRGWFFVSIAGIVTNLIIAFIASFFFVLLYDYTMWRLLFEWIMVINIMFAVFNLLPIPPLDGFNILASMAPYSKFVMFLRRYSMVMLVLLLMFIGYMEFLFLAREGIMQMFKAFWGLFF